MAFRELPHGRGLLYAPEQEPGQRKHPCRYCHACQQCGDDRCLLCRGRREAREEAPAAPPAEKPPSEE